MIKYCGDTGWWETRDRRSEEKLEKEEYRTDIDKDSMVKPMSGLQLQKDFTLTIDMVKCCSCQQ